MKTEKTAVLAVTSQQKQQQRLPTKKSITSINLFTLSTLIERNLLLAYFTCVSGILKKYYLKENIALTLIHGGATIIIVIA